MFDNVATRPQLQALYNAEQSLLSFEGQQMQVGIVPLDTPVATLPSPGRRQDHGEAAVPDLPEDRPPHHGRRLPAHV